MAADRDPGEQFHCAAEPSGFRRRSTDRRPRELIGPDGHSAGRPGAEDEIQNLRAKLVRVRDDERRAIASALHDSTLQLLTVSLWAAERASRQCGGDEQLSATLTEISTNVANARRQIANVAYMLYPRQVGTSSLNEAIEDLVAGFVRRSGLQISLETVDALNDQPAHIATAIVRILQEILQNICKHAKATCVQVRIDVAGRLVLIAIDDDSKGIGRVPARGEGGIGLMSVRDRVLALGGEFIMRELRKGSACRITLPGGREGHATPLRYGSARHNERVAPSS